MPSSLVYKPLIGMLYFGLLVHSSHHKVAVAIQHHTWHVSRNRNDLTSWRSERTSKCTIVKSWILQQKIVMCNFELITDVYIGASE